MQDFTNAEEIVRVMPENPSYCFVVPYPQKDNYYLIFVRKKGHGRTSDYSDAPAQIPASGITALGSSILLTTQSTQRLIEAKRELVVSLF